jgi:putative ABC transport system permease protein
VSGGLARWLTAWRAALRIARRDALRAKGRSALVVAMIALPVMAVVAVDVMVRTAEVTPAERITRELGAADASVKTPYGDSSVAQAPDAERHFPTGVVAPPADGPLPIAEVTAALPTGSRVIPYRQGQTQFVTENGRAHAWVHELDVTDEMTAGLFPVREGRAPAADGEVAVSPELRMRGFTVGATMRMGTDDRLQRIVGVIDDPQRLHQDVVVGPPGTLLRRGDVDAFSSGWLVDAPRPLRWSDVRAANETGLVILSKAVLLDPPPASAVEAEFGGARVDPGAAAVVGLVIAMALLEVVLLAGPAFAVGTRRQRRQLALVAVAGGDRRHIRRVVLSGGLVLGGVGGVLGAVLGVTVAALARQPLQRLSDSALGPVNLRLLEVGGVAALGALIGLLAALVPAILTSRQEVVTALQGRRGTLRSARRWPALGLVVAAGGVALAIWGATGRRDGPIIAGAITTQLGLLLAAPAVIGLVGTLAARMPLWLRFGARDAARHRSRSAPAVAAVMAAVAGSVALAIGGASDHAEQLAEYQPQLAAGNASVFLYDATAREREQVRGVLTSAFPDGTLVESRELAPPPDCGEECFLDVTTYGCDGASRTSRVCDEDHRRGVLVADTLALQTLIGDVPQAAKETLGSGGAVVFRPQHERGGQARLTLTQYQPRSDTSTELDSWSMPATVVPVRGTAPAYAVLSPEAAARTGLPTPLESLAVRTAELPSAELERQTNERLTAVLPLDGRPLYVERGYTESMALPFLILVAASALVTLGGTLVATGLAGADARADLATMAAIGAAPATRRRIAMSQAAVVAALGAGLGLIAGLVPGIAIAYPLTGRSYGPPGLDTVYVDVPWLVLGILVVAVPTLAVLTAGLFTRSRLPMVARAQ